MSKLRRVKDNQDNALLFRCPGCNIPHIIYYERSINGAWSWNNDLDKPTINPSIVVTREINENEIHVCHSYIRDGYIEFLHDSTHHLANKKVSLPEF